MMRRPVIFIGGPFSAALLPAEHGFTFDPELRTVFEAVHRAFVTAGAEVLSSHIEERFGEAIDESGMVSRDNAWVRKCDVYLALLPLDNQGIPYRTDGTHVEIGLAIAQRKQSILVVQQPASADRSFYMRNLGEEELVQIVDWDDFLPNVETRAADLVTQLRTAVRSNVSDPDDALRQMAAIETVDEITVRGVNLQVLPGVFSPRFSHSAEYLIERWHVPQGASVLDLGTGCGIFSVFALLEGAGSVIALDINPTAVENVVLNAERLGLASRLTARTSDIYAALSPEERFDVIVMSPPFWNRTPKTLLEAACYDEDYHFLKTALLESAAHAARSGHMFVVFSDQGDVALLLRLATKAGWTLHDFQLRGPTSARGHSRLFLDFTIN